MELITHLCGAKLRDCLSWEQALNERLELVCVLFQVARSQEPRIPHL